MMPVRFKLLSWAALLAAAGIGAAGCRQDATAPSSPLSPVDPPAPATMPARAETDYYADLAALLQAARRKDDSIIVDEILQWQAPRLERQLAVLKTLGPTASPERFPTAEARLAYWLNARAAWALQLAALAGCPKELTRAQLDRPFRLDGRTMRLADIDEILRADPDWRALVTAPGVTMDRAAMPDRPFWADDVRGRLAQRWEAFVGDPDRFRIDVQDKQVRVPPVVWPFRSLLIERYRRACNVRSATLWAALLDTVTGPGRRRLQDAVGFSLVEGRATLKTCFRKWYEPGR